MFKRLLRFLQKDDFSIVPAKPFGISRSNISNGALFIVDKLQEQGWEAFIVGGAIRDLLLNKNPKDFDVVTNARPEQIKKVFRKAIVIGRRFRLVHVYHGKEIIEVSTFRSNTDQSKNFDTTGRILRDNYFGTMIEDVSRRDLTINALYYNPFADNIFDYHGGIEHLRKKTVKIIGNSRKRLVEDPIRIIRIIRLSSKLSLVIPNSLKREMEKQGHLLKNIPKSRLADDLIKMFLSGNALRCYELLIELNLYQHILPPIKWPTEDKEKKVLKNRFMSSALNELDMRLKSDQVISLTFLFSVLLWQNISTKVGEFQRKGLNSYVSMKLAIDSIFTKGKDDFWFHKKHMIGIKELYLLQVRFDKYAGKSPYTLIRHRRFNAAWRLLSLRVILGEVDKKTVNWWENFFHGHDSVRKEMLEKAKSENKQYRRPKKNSRKLKIR